MLSTALEVAGVLLVAFGLFCAWPPAAAIVVGLYLVLAGYQQGASA